MFFVFFSCVKKNKWKKKKKTFFLQRMHLIIDPLCNDLIIG